MNELDHLRRMRSEVPEYTPEKLSLLTGWRPGGERTPRPAARRGLRMPLTLSGAAAAVTATAVALLVLSPLDRTDTVRPGPATETSGSGEDAMAAMAPVIEAARSRSAGDGVWHVRHSWGVAWGVGPDDDRYGVYQLYEEEWWGWSEDVEEGESRKTNAIVSTDWSLVDDDDRPAWQRDGSPTYWPRDPDTGRAEIPTAEEPQEEYPEPGFTLYGFGYSSLSLPDLQSLPSDPELLRETMFDTSEITPGGADLIELSQLRQGYVDVDTRRFALAKGVLDLPLPPEVRAGVYTVLAELPGVRPVDAATDVSGRAAVGVAHRFTTPEGAEVEERLLFDPGTGLPLSSEQVVLEPSASEADWSEPGDVVRYTLYDTLEWIDEPPL